MGSGEGRQIVVNAQSGVVFARGMPDELRAIADYLERIHGAAKRQVVLEAKIIEVTLQRRFPSRRELGGGAGAGRRRRARRRQLVGRRRSSARDLPLEPRGDPLTIGPGNPVTQLRERDDRRGVRVGARHRRLQRVRRAARGAGRDSRAVEPAGRDAEQSERPSSRPAPTSSSSPTCSSNTVTGTAATTSRDVTLTPFFSGIALDVTPQISADRRGHPAHSPDGQRGDGSDEGAHGVGRDRHAAARVQRDSRVRQHRESEERPDHRDRRPHAQLVAASIEFSIAVCSAACRGSSACSAALERSKRRPSS